jgi:hypothetical protein
MPPTRMWRWVVNVASPTNKSRFSSRKSESGRSRFANTFTKVNDIRRRRHCHRLKNHAQLMPPTLNGSRPKLPQTSDHYATISMLSTLSYPNVLHNNTNRCRNFKPVTLEPRLWPCRERKATRPTAHKPSLQIPSWGPATGFFIPTGRTEPAGPVPVYRSSSVGNR